MVENRYSWSWERDWLEGRIRLPGQEGTVGLAELEDRFGQNMVNDCLRQEERLARLERIDLLG